MAHDPAVADLESFLAAAGRAAAAHRGAAHREQGGGRGPAAGRDWSGCCGTGPAIVGDPEGYLRRTLYNLAADGWRRQRAWRRRLPLLQSETATSVADGTREVDTRDALIRLLVQLPPRQRAVIVARYWEQLSEAETAVVLGCSVGSVKASASRGLQRLRELSGISTENDLAEEKTP